MRVYGEDLTILRQQATRMKQLLSQVDGVVDPQVESVATQPTVAIKVNLNSGLRYGIKPGDVRRKVATLLSRHPGRQRLPGGEGVRRRGAGEPTRAAA